MVVIASNYKVYLHVFPGGKKYVGCAKNDLRSRWRGGLGYENQKRVFNAIVELGWNNIKHYILLDNLSKKEAYIFEAAFINKWHTYWKSKGYNTISPDIEEANTVSVPSFRDCPKKLIDDYWDEDIITRYNKSLNRPGRKKVRCIETGEIFRDAQQVFNSNPFILEKRWVYCAILRGHSAGLYEVKYIDDDGTEIVEQYPAHWEYV